MPERLRIPGFLRGTRWIARDAGPRYCVLYEVADLAVLDSAPYRERLDHPTPWTTTMMRAYAGMRRALCTVGADSGCGLGSTALIIRFAPAQGAAARLHGWLADDILPALARRPGLAGCRLLHNSLVAPMTREQAIRGRDASVHSAVVATGYDEHALAALAAGELAPERFAARGADPAAHACGLYRQAFALTAQDARAAQ
jgi:hypothetical protein